MNTKKLELHNSKNQKIINNKQTETDLFLSLDQGIEFIKELELVHYTKKDLKYIGYLQHYGKKGDQNLSLGFFEQKIDGMRIMSKEQLENTKFYYHTFTISNCYAINVSDCGVNWLEYIYINTLIRKKIAKGEKIKSSNIHNEIGINGDYFMDNLNQNEKKFLKRIQKAQRTLRNLHLECSDDIFIEKTGDIATKIIKELDLPENIIFKYKNSIEKIEEEAPDSYLILDNRILKNKTKELYIPREEWAKKHFKRLEEEIYTKIGNNVTHNSMAFENIKKRLLFIERFINRSEKDWGYDNTFINHMKKRKKIIEETLIQ